MKKLNRVTAVICGVIVMPIIGLICENARAEVTVSLVKRTNLANWGRCAAHTWEEHTFVIKRSTDNRPYYIKYSHCSDPIHQEEKTAVGNHDIGLGLQLPVAAGWYINNSIEVVANGDISNGKIVTRAVIADYIALELKDRALICFSWDTEEAKVIFIFQVSDQTDGIFLEAMITPKEELDSLKFFLHNYPSVHNKLQLELSTENWIVVPTGNELSVLSGESTKKLTLSLPKDYWIFFADKVLDPETSTNATGPSGLVFMPGNIDGGMVDISGYHVGTYLDLPNAGGSFRLGFFEFSYWANIKALSYLRQKGNSIKDMLAKSDFNISKLFRLDINKAINIIQERVFSINESELKREDTAVYSKFKTEIISIQETLKKTGLSFAEMKNIQEKTKSLLEEVTVFAFKELVK